MKKIDSRFHNNIVMPIKIESMKARELVNSNRVDIIIKIAYLKSLLNEDYELIQYYEKLYLKTIDAFTDGTFHEPGDSDKKSPNDYVNQFRKLITSITKDGFEPNISVIPISPSNTPLDGAHRLAIGYYLDLTLPVVKLRDIDCQYGIPFFHKKSKDLDLTYQLIEELINFDEQIRIAIIWPFSKFNDVENIKTFFGERFIFSTSMNLNSNGVNNLCVNAYEKEAWIGNHDNDWAGSWNKSAHTFSNGYKTHIILYKSKSDEDDLGLKSEFRKKYNNSKHCIHTTDNKIETLKISQVTFYPESEKYLNSFNLKRFKMVYDFIGNNGIDAEKIIITGSSLLHILELRTANDIDYLIIDNENLCSKKDFFDESHNKYINYYESPLNELFKNKNSTYNFLGIRFLPLNDIGKFKKNRKERKDLDDIKLIEIFLNGTYGYKLIFIKLKRNLSLFFSRKKRALSNMIIITLKKFGLYDIVKKMIKK
ncbi:hypothetical protein J7S50_17360 [Providencia rettgeri]|uniref:hypothetical protein n=1 Tax=Providencia rettgeri TaxID=587 RepID=UPI001B37621E|nr:hypothetical protein [Providencia rettgeri]MBQ0210953.1 hypothetical protein [Providencia rettgeri]